MGRLGPRLKEWDKLGPQQKRKETQHLYDELKKTSESREVEPAQIVGSLLHRLEVIQLSLLTELNANLD